MELILRKGMKFYVLDHLHGNYDLYVILIGNDPRIPPSYDTVLKVTSDPKITHDLLPVVSTR